MQETNQYCNVLVESGLRAASETPHSPSHWFDQYHTWYKQENEKGLRALRRVIFNQTLQVCKKREQQFAHRAISAFRTFAFTTTSLQELLQEENEHKQSPLRRGVLGFWTSKNPSVAAAASMLDPIDIAVTLSASDERPRVLIAASLAADGNGGGVMRGCDNFEADLFRRSDLSSFLSKQEFPLAPSVVLVAPQVAMMRSSEQQGYTFYPNPVYVDVAGVATIQKQNSTDDESVTSAKQRLGQLMAAEGTLREYIRTSLAIGSMNRYGVLVLSFPQVNSNCNEQLLRCRFAALVGEEVLQAQRNVQLGYLTQVIVASATQDMQNAMESALCDPYTDGAIHDQYYD